MAKTKLKSADIWFSKCVRKSANWTCKKCGKQYQEGDTGLHNSHVYSRRHRTIRWCKENGISMCYACHNWFGGNHSGDWVIKFLGEGVIERLREKRDSGIKVSKLEEKDIASHYRKEYNRIEPGEDFESWQ